MPPKKKANNKTDDLEPELGGTIDPTPVKDVADMSVEANVEEEFPAGGLMAMMRKRQKKKKGQQEIFVEGEDPPQVEELDLSEKAPVEASMENEFALPDVKGKGKGSSAPTEPAKLDNEDDERGADGKVLTKAQKEKLKKEREKQRKKENVSPGLQYILLNSDRVPSRRPKRKHQPLLRKLLSQWLNQQKSRQCRSLLLLVKARNCHPHLPNFRRNRRS